MANIIYKHCYHIYDGMFSMTELKFRRKVIMSNRSLMVNIPIEIAEAMDFRKGDEIVITYQDRSFICKKNEAN